MEDEDLLISKVKGGDLPAYEKLIQPYIPVIRVQVAHFYPNMSMVDELTQQVFIYAFQNIDKFKQGNLRAWFKAIARNMVLRERKNLQQKARNQQNLQEFLIVKHAGENDSEQVDYLEDCLSQLKE